MRKVVIVLAFSFLSAPAFAQIFNPVAPPESSNVEPTNYRDDITAALRAGLKDPRSVRDAMISQPMLVWMGAANRFVVCVRYNAKNSFGGYAGLTDVMAVFVAGRFKAIDEVSGNQCRNAHYQPYSELMKLR